MNGLKIKSKKNLKREREKELKKENRCCIAYNL